MIVEDDPATLHALARLLGARGWEVTTAGTVAEALRSLDQPPEWIILDLGLPDGDGREVLERVRWERMPTKVAVCSGLDDESAYAGLVRLSPELILRKPIDLWSLFAVIGGGS